MSVSFFWAKTSLGWCFWVLLCLLAVLRFPANVIAQASNSNPFIWQIVVEYDIVKSNQSGTYVPGTSYKVYSQDFQTVFGDRDIYGYNERLVLDFGDGCPGTTIDDIQTLNGQVATSPSMMAQASIALIQRGGRCEFWSDKINHTQTLSEQYDLNIGAALIYNNISYNETQLVDEATSNSSYPIWSSPLPAERNINYMQDNDIKGDLGSIFMAVIFGPIQYGERLIDNYIREYSATPGVNQKLRYLQIRAFFSETSFSLDDGDNRINGSTGDNGDDGFWAVFSGDRGYLAYMIVAAAAFIVGIVLLRWCRTSRGLRSPPAQMSQEPNPLATAENGMAMQPMGASAQRNAPRHLTFEKLNELCPVLSLTEGNPKNSVCAICIEELSPASKMRILPCGHGFCVTCIDVWLTKKSSLCPICKYDCDPIVEESTTSTAATTQAEGNPASTPPVEMSDSDNHNNHQTQTSETQRSTPLQPQEQQEQQQQQQSTMEINHRQ